MVNILKVRYWVGVLFFMAIFNCTFFANAQQVTSQAEIIVDFGSSERTDSLQLIVYNNNYIGQIGFLSEGGFDRIVSPIVNGKCHFKIQIKDGPKYYRLNGKVGNMNDNRLIAKNIVDKGDSVIISIDDAGLTFAGNGATKMSMYYDFRRDNQIVMKVIMDRIDAPVFRFKNMGFIYRIVKESELAAKFWIELIKNNKRFYSKEVYELLLADFVGHNQYVATGYVRRNIDSSFSLEELRSIIDLFEESLIDLKEIAPELLARSEDWADYLYEAAHLKRAMGNVEIGIYDYLKIENKGVILDKLLTKYLLSFSKHIEGADSLLKDASTLIKDPYYIARLSNLADNQKKGAKAKDFQLLNYEGEVVSLSDYKGKIVFLDFWFVGCGACIVYNKKSVSSALEYFKGRDDIVFISICIEKDSKKWMNAVMTNEYTSLSSVNLYTGELAWLHPAIKDYDILGAPTPFLIDKEGYIFSANSLELGRRDGKVLIETIENCLGQ